MEFTCEKVKLAQALGVVSKATNSRSPLPILSHILFEAIGEDRLKLTATDLDLGFVAEIEAQVLTPGAAAIPARLLTEIVGHLSSSPVTIKVGSNARAIIESGRSRFEVTTMAAEEFPAVPEVPSDFNLMLPNRELRSILRRIVLAAASADESRAVMTGVLIKCSQGALELVATDGRRLAYQRRPMDGQTTPDFEAIIPGKALQELTRVIGDSQDQVGLFISEGMMHARCGGISLNSRLLEGVFPDYRRVLPREFQRHVRVGREALLGGLQRMLVVAQEKQSPNLVVFQVEDGVLNLTANTPDLGVGEEQISIVLEGEPLTIAFNGRYWIDILSVFDCDEVTLSFQDVSRSGVVSPFGEEDYRYVLMPVRLREDSETLD